MLDYESAGRVMMNMFWVVVICTTLISGCVFFVAGRLSSKSYEDVIKERERQAVVESLTPEQRKALGL